MEACRCTPYLKCCTEGVANSSLPMLELHLQRLKESNMDIEDGAVRIISSRTLRIQDLLRAYANELEQFDYDPDSPYSTWVKDAYDIASQIEQLDNEYELYEQASWLLEDLSNALNEYAPEGMYFGTNPHTPDEKGWFPIDWE